MKFWGIFGVKWVSMGSMWSVGFFEVHLVLVRFNEVL